MGDQTETFRACSSRYGGIGSCTEDCWAICFFQDKEGAQNSELEFESEAAPQANTSQLLVGYKVMTWQGTFNTEHSVPIERQIIQD